MSTKLTNERRQELKAELDKVITDLLDPGKVLPKTALRPSRSIEDYTNIVYQAIDRLRDNSSSIENRKAKTLEVLGASINLARLLTEAEELVKDAKQTKVYYVHPTTRISSAMAYVFDDKTGILNSGESITVGDLHTEVCDFTESKGKYFDSIVTALDWKVRSLGNWVNQYPKNKDYRANLEYAEADYKEALATEGKNVRIYETPGSSKFKVPKQRAVNYANFVQGVNNNNVVFEAVPDGRLYINDVPVEADVQGIRIDYNAG